jgi:hypothetical protein
LQRVRGEHETEVQRVRGEHASDVQRVRGDLESELQRTRAELDAERERTRAALAQAATAAGSSAANVSGLAEAVRELDATRTLTQALDTLVTHAARIAGRAALFLVDGERLKAWKAVGLAEADARSGETSITGHDLLARAIQTGDGTPAAADLPAPAFARVAADHPAWAVPVMIGGRAVAVLYADGEATSAFALVQSLARHASSVVALRTATRTLDVIRGVAEGTNADEGDEAAKRFARLLVSEIKMYNEAAVRTGRQERDLLQRLNAEIARARRLYEERVPATVAARHVYFQQELVHTLADGDAALLGNT